MTIFAVRSDNPGPVYKVDTIRNQGRWSLRVPAGVYQVYAVPSSGFGPAPQHFDGAYTKYVVCGLSTACSDHTVIPITVRAGQTATGVNVTDFYAGQDAFPLVPSFHPAVRESASPAAGYPDVIAAARYEAQRGTGAAHILTGAFSLCPVNQSCVALGDQQLGTNAAYVVAKAGSNTEFMTCGVYVFQDAAGWHPLNTACGEYPALGKTVGATFIGSGCINVRAGPGYTNRIVQCVPVDTTVTIDGGPVYIREGSASDAADLNRVWWRLVGRGWMVHQYLTGPFNGS